MVLAWSWLSRSTLQKANGTKDQRQTGETFFYHRKNRDVGGAVSESDQVLVAVQKAMWPIG
ncbi:hypothetical protein [Brucella haematophila]|uniref:hypothetical protein n=1 Tax=Brucella haematophila TaxID=419474 RepID=UPI00110EB586|nr:hypothetical protein [Brucella haematophila]TMV04533.1 hypothetical protein FGI60_06545 [Brucella haematophila]